MALTETQVLVYTAGGIIAMSLATITLVNRQKINTLFQRLLGTPGDDSRGGEGHIVRMERKLDDMKDRREDLDERITETQRCIDKMQQQMNEQHTQVYEKLEEMNGDA